MVGLVSQRLIQKNKLVMGGGVGGGGRLVYTLVMKQIDTLHCLIRSSVMSQFSVLLFLQFEQTLKLCFLVQ